MKRKHLAAAAVLLAAALILPGFYTGLAVRQYTVDLPGVTGPIRMAVVSDLHSCGYGEKAERLVEAVDARQPDLIALTGDIFDDRLPPDHTVAFLEAVAGRYPCFYVTGNHEYWCAPEDFRRDMDTLRELGVRRLAGEAAVLTLRGETLAVCGVDDPDAYLLAAAEPEGAPDFAGQLARVRELSRQADGAVLLSHRPESMPLYRYLGFELVLSGHAHGGQWRIPGLLNGFYAPDQGFFPEYAGGIYREDGTTLIVSRGLARETTRIPRFYNPPELVIVDIV